MSKAESRMSIETSMIPYDVGGAPYQGVLVGSGDPADPLAVMAPDWMGVGQGAIAMAQMIASWGATVFVADVYGAGRRPSTIEEAQAFSDPLKSDQAEVRTRIRAALEVARRQCPSPHVAAIGFCFGGMNVLELARSGADLVLAVSIHGDLLTTRPAGRGDIKGEILVLHGAADPVSPKSQRDAFEAEMEAAGATWMMSIFGKAVHSFTNPDARLEGIAHYDAYAADWTLAILRRALRERARSGEPLAE